MLDERTKDMTVQEWWEDYMLTMENKAQSTVDDAIDLLTLNHKNQREDIRNRQHERKLTKDLKTKIMNNQNITAVTTGKKGSSTSSSSSSSTATSTSSTFPVYDVQLTILQSLADPDRNGQSFTITPRNAPGSGGMCRLGRSNDNNFQLPYGCSFSYDPSISHWHGKITMNYGIVYYTDLGSSNGSYLNNQSLERDVPYPINTNDILQLGGSLDLKITLVPIGNGTVNFNNSFTTSSSGGKTTNTTGGLMDTGL